MNNNKVINKQISINSIIEVAKYLENHKSEYDKQFELEENKNKNIPYGEKNYEYEYGDTSLKYTIEFKNGKNIVAAAFVKVKTAYPVAVIQNLCYFGFKYVPERKHGSLSGFFPGPAEDLPRVWPLLGQKKKLYGCPVFFLYAVKPRRYYP